MIGALPLEYAQARLQARYGQRGDEPLWNQLRGARSLVAALETLRTSPLRRWVAAIPFDADADEIELRLRTELRSCIAEVAGWAPGEWQSAIAWTAHLVDLPAVARLADGEPPAPWMRRDAQRAARRGGHGNRVAPRGERGQAREPDRRGARRLA
jgi:hypothetical protein